ncbi:MAG: hypothetical protein ACYS29_16310, partial [Planctomycetota bacterium]
MLDSEIAIRFEPSNTGSTKGLLTVRQNNELLHSDVIDIAKDKDRTAFANKLHKQYAGISADDIKKHLISEVDQILQENSKAQQASVEQHEDDPLENTPQPVKDDALTVLKSADLFEQIYSDIASMGVAGEQELSLTVYVVMTSRLIGKPLSAVVQGASSSGKTFTIEVVARLMPPEEVVQA